MINDQYISLHDDSYLFLVAFHLFAFTISLSKKNKIIVILVHINLSNLLSSLFFFGTIGKHYPDCYLREICTQVDFEFRLTGFFGDCARLW